MFLLLVAEPFQECIDDASLFLAEFENLPHVMIKEVLMQLHEDLLLTLALDDLPVLECKQICKQTRKKSRIDEKRKEYRFFFLFWHMMPLLLLSKQKPG